MKHADALLIACRLKLMLQPACQKIVIAGSLRRKMREVGDIELVILPQPNSLFDNVNLENETAAHEAIRKMLEDGILVVNPERKCDGLRYKQLVDPDSGIKIDLFFADEENFGCTLGLRTGDEHFSHSMVTPFRTGGCMPAHLRQKDGYLWRCAGSFQTPVKIPCLKEEEWFTAIGVRMLQPEKRNGRAAIHLREELKHGKH